MTYTMMNQKKK